jgi:excisionase family DNA binding protein
VGELFGVRKSTAARLLDCSRWTIDRLIRDGDLEVFQLRGEPRVRFDSIRRLVERNTLQAAQ